VVATLSDPTQVNIRPFTQSDTELVISLWQSCGLIRSWNNPQLDIERKLTVNPEWFVVGVVKHEIVASAMFGYEGHRGWVNYLAVSPQHQRQGYAKQLMQFGEDLLLNVGCPKLNLQVRDTNAQALGFYEALGYKIDASVSLGKRLIPDE
jgi:ribosomal protein S18 acetylase RimI-like enzyme